MYLWDINNISYRLKEKTVSQSKMLKYLFTLIIVNVFSYLIFYKSNTIISNNAYDNSVNIIINIIGILSCYILNKKGDNSEFFKRFVCLCLPIGIRVELLAFLSYAFVMGIVFVFCFIVESSFAQLILNPVFPILHKTFGYIVLVIIYFWIWAKIKDICNNY